jgi:prepilin-type N-terminal cleavage/methylation domain-containing protein/prepilin-type processing-associated H-X9-DG protein
MPHPIALRQPADRRAFTLIELLTCQPKLQRRQARGAFTLIELLVVIAIIALLVSILLPSLNRAKELGKTAVCVSHFRQIGQGFGLYASTHQGFGPVTKNEDKNKMWTCHISEFVGGPKMNGAGGLWSVDHDNSLLYGCPNFVYNPNTYWVTGYGMNPFVMAPEPDGVNGNSSYWAWYGGSKLPSIKGGYKHMATQWTKPSSHAFLTDTIDWHFFPDRHTGDVKAEFRHGDRAPFLFVDGHVATQANGFEAVDSVINP